MRRPSPIRDHDNSTSSMPSARGVNHGFTAFSSSSVLPPLKEDTSSLYAKEEDATNNVLNSNLSPSGLLNDSSANIKTGAINGGDIFSSDSGANRSPILASPKSPVRSLSPASFFTRRRGGSLSSALPSQIDTTPLSPPLPLDAVPSSPLQASSPTLSPSPTLTNSDSPHNHNLLHVPFMSSVTMETIPLQSCCKTCIATLIAHPSSLRPLASEKEAHWTARAWAKKMADEREEEAIRASANVASAGSSGLVDGKEKRQEQTWGDHVMEKLQAAGESGSAVSSGVPIKDNVHLGAKTEAEVVVVKRTPLSAASLKRNRELRASFSPENALSAADRVVESINRSRPETPNPTTAADETTEEEDSEQLKDLNLVDVGVPALRPHGRLQRRDSENDEDQEENGDGDFFDEEDQDVVSSPLPLPESFPSSSSPHHLAASAPSSSSPPPSVGSPHSLPSPPISSSREGRLGLLNRLRRGSAAAASTASPPTTSHTDPTSSLQSDSSIARSRSFPTPPPPRPILKNTNSIAKTTSTIGGMTLNPFSSFGRLPGVTS